MNGESTVGAGGRMCEECVKETNVVGCRKDLIGRSAKTMVCWKRPGKRREIAGVREETGATE